MNSVDHENKVWDFAGSIGWFIDRAGETEQILGTVWLVADGQVATCATTVVPFEDILDALIVRFPGTGEVWGVKEARFHSGFDRWLAKRALSQAAFHPSVSVDNQQHNIVLLRLSDRVKALDPVTITKFNRLLLRILPQEAAGFSGRVTNVELTSILQMLVNARREGTIVICDPRKRPTARIFCEDGRIAYAKFGLSTNEAALYKLICSSFSGFFYFQEERRPEWCDFAPMLTGMTSVVMEGYRRLELKTQLLEQLGGESSILRKRKYKPHFENLLPNTQADAQVVWCYVYDGMPISRLLRVSGLDNSLVMAALHELLMHDNITVSGTETVPNFAHVCSPLPRSTHDPSPGDQIFAISHDASLSPHLASGRIICQRKPGDPFHQVHTIALPDEAMGTPIFKDDEVIGMYCGQLIRDQSEPQEFAYMQQILWVSAVGSCV